MNHPRWKPQLLRQNETAWFENKKTHHQHESWNWNLLKAKGLEPAF